MICANKSSTVFTFNSLFLPIYRGEVRLADSPYQEMQKDEDGNLRKVWMFPLKLMSENQLVDSTLLRDYVHAREKSAHKLTTNEVKRRALLCGSKRVSQRSVTSSQYIRDPYVAEYTKRRADGVCQLCEQPAPFLGKDGTPYLESHHIEWLSQGGEDTIKNTAALCPNCHIKMHVLNLTEDVQLLQGKAAECGD